MWRQHQPEAGADAGTEAESGTGTDSGAEAESETESESESESEAAHRYCRFNEANYGYALDGACPALATAHAARVAAPAVRAVDIAAARGADASPKIRLYVAQQLAAEAAADPATATRLVDLLVHERDDKTRNQITRHLFARGQTPLVRAAAEIWLVDPDDDVRMIGLGTITDDHFATDAAAEAALGALLRAERDTSVRTAACAAGGAFAGATLAPIVDELLVDPGLDVAVAAGCVEGLVALWGNGARADAVRAAAFARTMTQLTTRPRGPAFPTSIAIDRITDALRPSVANPAPATAATWFDAPRLRAALTALLRDTTADWIARSHAAGEKSWLASGLLSLLLGPLGWLYAGAWREAIPAAAGWLGVAALFSMLPMFMMMPVMMVAMPVSAIVGVVYAAKFNRTGKRQRILGPKPDAKSPTKLKAGQGAGRLGAGKRR